LRLSAWARPGPARAADGGAKRPAEQPDITGPLAAYLALFHICGPRELAANLFPALRADIFSVWSATGPELKAVLKCQGACVVCPELGTKYPAMA
jgi:hypothetical protein